MKAQVLTGSKKEIADSIAQIQGDVHEVIAFIEEPVAASEQREDIFAEMEPFTVTVGGADYSRQSLYARVEGE